MKNFQNALKFAACRIFPVWALLISTIALAAEATKQQTDQNHTTCELVLEGKNIEKLVLLDGHGLSKTFTRPDSSLFLPPGNYTIQEVSLGDYYALLYPNLEKNRFTLTPDKPFHLKLGGSLTPEVALKRQGRFLTMDYKLLGVDGRRYLNRQRINPAQFAVYLDDQKIASGAFK